MNYIKIDTFFKDLSDKRIEEIQDIAHKSAQEILCKITQKELYYLQGVIKKAVNKHLDTMIFLALDTGKI